MAQSIITLAFETYKAQQQESGAQPVELNEFVLANVPGLDPDVVIDRSETLPPAEQIVCAADVSQSGFVNPNAVVYSLIMDTGVGDFEFNWVGLRNKETGVLAAILHTPVIQKYKSIVGVQNGNSVTRSIMMAYEGAQDATGITVDASTWQIDFTARLAGMDERERLANRDLYGDGAFYADGFKVALSGSDYLATQGIGYVGGLRCELDNNLVIADVIKPGGVYLDACWKGQLTSQWQSEFVLTTSAGVLTDYVDGDNYQHYVTKIADIDAAGNITDRRNVEGFAEYERAENAATNADIDAESTAIKHIKLPQFWRGLANKISTAFSGRTINTTSPLNGGGNLSQDRTLSIDSATTSQKGVVQLSDSVTSTSSVLAATVKAVNTAYDKAVAAYNLAGTKLNADATAVNANKLNSLNSSQFLRSDAADTSKGLTIDNTGRMSGGYSWTGSSLQTTSLEIRDSDADDEDVCATLFMHNYGDGGVQFRMGNAGDKWLYLSSGDSDAANRTTDDNAGTFFEGVKINGNQIWHAGNDGAGSGLDADKLDNLDSSQFLRSDLSDTKTSGRLRFNDAVKLVLGSDEDVEHFWNGSDYYTDINGGANWYIRDGNSSNATRFTFDVDNGRFYGNQLVAGESSGSVALTVNDGYGNANIAFNHRDGVPDVNGSCGRISCDVDSTHSCMTFELADNATADTETPTENILVLEYEKITAKKPLYDSEGGQVYSPNNPPPAVSDVPVGIPLPWSQPTPPSGYLECKGQTFSTSAYPKLAEAYPDGVLPDLRGEFIRGWDNGRGVDSGRGILTAQSDLFKSHSHSVTRWGQLAKVTAGGTGNIWDGTGSGNTGSLGGGETRPRNIAFMYIVRAA